MDSLFRNLPSFKGKNRLAGAFLKKKLGTLKDVRVKGRYGCDYLLPNLIENVSREIFINGIYEKTTSDFFAERAEKGAIFMDLGANIGAISVPLSRKRNDLTIVCVEAAPWLFPYLQQNVGQNGAGRTTFVNKALFNTDDQEIDFYSPDVKFGKGSFSPTYTHKSVKVAAIRLDTLVRQLQLPRVDFIKMDVEGYECHVFQGAETLLEREDAPDILFEFEDWAEELAKQEPGSAQNYLLGKGYKLFRHGADARLYPLTAALTKGSTMILATKKSSRYRAA